MIGWRGGYGAPKAPGRAPDVVVIVSGGLVQDVLRDPDLTVEVRDYDVSDYGEPHEWDGDDPNTARCKHCRCGTGIGENGPKPDHWCRAREGFEQDDAGDWFSRSTYESDEGRTRKRRRAS